jgi:hypothetical protein
VVEHLVFNHKDLIQAKNLKTLLCINGNFRKAHKYR